MRWLSTVMLLLLHGTHSRDLCLFIFPFTHWQLLLIKMSVACDGVGGVLEQSTHGKIK
jgi:hypothetical protein